MKMSINVQVFVYIVVTWIFMNHGCVWCKSDKVEQKKSFPIFPFMKITPALSSNISDTVASEKSIPTDIEEDTAVVEEIHIENFRKCPAVLKSDQTDGEQSSCRATTFRDFINGIDAHDSNIGSFPYGDDLLANQSELLKKITCSPRNSTEQLDTPTVLIYNSSELLQLLGSKNGTGNRCTIVLFYASWCAFSARVAPHYNALARAFPSLDVVAIDTYNFSHLNSRFGTIAVPNIMVFHNGRGVARFNGTERTLEYMSMFVANVTGIPANSSVVVTDDDFIGPLPSEPISEVDYLLILSWVFIILCSSVAFTRSDVGMRVWNTLVAIVGHHDDRPHQNID